LASGHVLFSELGLDAASIIFETTHSGPLIVSRDAGRYEMDFPADPPVPVEAPAGLAAALGVTPNEVWSGQYLLAVLAGEGELRALQPNLEVLKAIGIGGRGVGNLGVSSVADAGKPYDVVSRFFAPGSGIAEDPATGSFHCIASPLFSGKLGRSTLRFHQAYPGRGGDLECEHRGDRVMLRGTAVTTVEGRLRV
jgi:predicted PhzF superfamily epimerase YddE/YHI9